MLVRNARVEDCKIVYEWRNDQLTREMFFDSNKVSYDNHIEWFRETLKDPTKSMFIGEILGEPIGVCRFDLDKNKSKNTVSININPQKRGMGLGTTFLNKSIKLFYLRNKGDLISTVKINNYPSNKIFKNADFKIIAEKDNVIEYLRKEYTLVFKAVTEEDVEILYKILKARTHSISHNSMPKFENHKKFVLSEPYRHWYIIYENYMHEGTFYIQNNNSIGINIFTPTLSKITEILQFINNKFEPNDAIPSMIPNYFYVNVSEKNTDLLMILDKMGCIPIQRSYRSNF